MRSGSEGRVIRRSAWALAWLRAFSASSFVNNGLLLPCLIVYSPWRYKKMYFFGVFVRVSNFLSVPRTPAPQDQSGDLSDLSLFETKHTFSSQTFLLRNHFFPLTSRGATKFADK